MEITLAGFSEEVARLIHASDDHPSVALCRLAKSRTLFSELTTGMRDRLAAIHTMEEPVEIPPELAPMAATAGIHVSRRVFRLFACTVIAAAMAMAALGYRLGQTPPNQQFLNLPGIIGRAADTWGRVWPASQTPAPASNQEGGA